MGQMTHPKHWHTEIDAALQLLKEHGRRVDPSYAVRPVGQMVHVVDGLHLSDDQLIEHARRVARQEA